MIRSNFDFEARIPLDVNRISKKTGGGEERREINKKQTGIKVE